jgi:glycosyltransferase involved in cell wall biosynthesis
MAHMSSRYFNYVRSVVKFARQIKIKLCGKKDKIFLNQICPQFCSQEASDLIKEFLQNDKPCMIARFGSVEMDCIDNYRERKKSVFKRYFRYINGDTDTLDWNKSIIQAMQNNAGFFPIDNLNLNLFSEVMLESMRNLDVLGSWLEKENNFKNELLHVKTVRLSDLEPYFHLRPWSSVLRGKKVLVIHPFVDSIQTQYKKRIDLFRNLEILPEFELITYKPVESFAGNHEFLKFDTWFEALETMKKEIEFINFDIAIIGCGAYGFCLASFVKSIGKKSIHMGGATQILFGIKGKRWERENDLSPLFNEHWSRPLETEVPLNYKTIENGCYW